MNCSIQLFFNLRAVGDKELHGTLVIAVWWIAPFTAGIRLTSRDVFEPQLLQLGLCVIFLPTLTPGWLATNHQTICKESVQGFPASLRLQLFFSVLTIW